MSKTSRLITLGILGGGAAADTTAPTVTIASTESSPSFANPIPITFTLSEVSTDFALADVTVGTGGTLGNFAGSGMSYTADLTITTAGATVTVDVAENTFHDAAGNGNTAATQFSITSGLTLKDAFTTDDEAPLTTPRTCEPGPGTLTGSNEGYLSIASGKLVMGDHTTVKGVYNGSTIAHAAGLAYKCSITNIGTRVDMSIGTVGFASTQIASIDTGGNARVPGVSINGLGASGTGTYCLIRSETGRIYIFKDTTLVWVSTETSTSAATYSLFVAGVAGWSGQADDFKIGILPAPFTTDRGIATNYIASPSSGDTLTHEANSLVEITWTAATGATLEFDVRRTDDSARWVVRCDQAGSTIKLIEVNAGETERNSVAQTWANGTAYRIVVTMDGNAISTRVNNTAKNSYSSASFNNTATIAKITPSAGAIANFTAWPRTLSGTALAVFNSF